MSISYRPLRTALALLAYSGVAVAQQAMPEATGASTTFSINGFELTGDIPLPSSETTQVLAPFIGSGKTLVSLQQATAALEAALRDKGFALHRVALPPQEVGDKVKLNVVKFVIGTVTVEGNSGFTTANIRASLPELREGEAPNFQALAVQTTIANESAGKQVQVGLKESEEADKIDAKIVVKETSPWNLSASMANTGTEATGRDRFSLVGGHSNLFGLDHQLSLAYTTSLERSGDVRQVGVNYRIPLYRLGGVVGLSYTNSDVVGSFGSFTSTGAGQTTGLSYSHYLPPDGGRKTFVSLGVEGKTFNAGKINGIAVPGQMDRATRPITLGYNARIESDTAVWGYNAELARNLSSGSANSLEAFQAEDPRIRTANWLALRGAANYLSTFGAGWLWSVRGQFQYSPDALISGEQFGLGGSGSVRGTSDRVISGDSGVFASLELSSPEWLPGLRVLGFLDAGWLSSSNTDLNPAKASSDRMSSTGLGLRFGRDAVALSAEWGRLLGAPEGALAGVSGLPKAGDDKLHVNLNVRF